MSKRVIIDCLPESVERYRPGWAIVAVDVIRATTTATTAAATGRRCFPAPTAEAAMAIANKLDNPLLAGDSNSTLPAIFEMGNSPSHMASRADTHRPLVLVSSSGTKVIHEAAGCAATYLGCFRSHTVLAGYLAQRHARVAVIGAGSKGEFREEDQICCAWIAAGLMKKGHLPGIRRPWKLCAAGETLRRARACAAAAWTSCGGRTSSTTWTSFSNTSTTCARFSRFGMER